jgi:hypothetical protein
VLLDVNVVRSQPASGAHVVVSDDQDLPDKVKAA